MSVILKGMKMPLNCALCERGSICECLKEYKDYESILYAVDDGDLVRADDCPLIELPPHGRLIDIKSVEDGKFVTVSNDYQRWWNGALESVIDNAPTVIETEGSEE